MKILQINNFYPVGSTGKITADIHRHLLGQGVESVVCYGRGEVLDQPHVYKTCGERYARFDDLATLFIGLPYGRHGLSTRKLISVIKREKPNVVHLQCINCGFVNIYELIIWLKKHRVKTVLTLHAEFMFTANCGHALDCDKWLTGCGHCPRLKEERQYRFRLWDDTAASWKRMKKAFEGFEKDCVVASVSPWLMERAKRSPILKNFRHCTVFNGIDAEDTFHLREAGALRDKHSLTDEKVIFHPTAYFYAAPGHIKGGRYVLELAERLKGENLKFIVAGPYDPAIVPPENMILLGNLTDQKLLAQYYSMADVTVITSLRETFSMIVAESTCCGTPVVGFKAGGPESIAIPDHCTFVEQRDMDALEAAVRQRLAQPKDSAAIAEAGQNAYRAERMCAEYRAIYDRLAREET